MIILILLSLSSVSYQTLPEVIKLGKTEILLTCKSSWIIVFPQPYFGKGHMEIIPGYFHHLITLFAVVITC